MIPTDTLERELTTLFGEDAELATQTYVQTIRALHQMAVSASEENVNRSQNGTPALTPIYAREAVVFASLAQELRRATARVRDLLDGETLTISLEKGNQRCNS